MPNPTAAANGTHHDRFVFRLRQHRRPADQPVPARDRPRRRVPRRHRPLPLLVRASRPVFPPVFLRAGPRGNAVQPRRALVGLPRGEGRGQHRRFRLDAAPQPDRHADVHQRRLPGARRGRAARRRDHRRRELPRAVHDARDLQHLGDELRRHLAPRCARAVGRRGQGRRLAQHRRRRPVALPSTAAGRQPTSTTASTRHASRRSPASPTCA